ncbi:hypothetical protein LV35_04271 [Acinetobacter baumannii]|uniref:Core-binding (CB) domain-containing protein n=1 Tax=Acinetobacter baumannii TaxID=470 RepID=A0AAJ0QS84_ACIBA|nr:hypothetical protein LV35_04271 [Acinetobacter baumannii]
MLRAWYIDTAGKQRTKKFPNKKGAKRWADDQANKINTGTWVAPEVASETFATVAEKWYATKSNREATTKHGYRNILDTIVLPKWGKDSLASIDHESLQDWINELSTTSEYRTKGLRGLLGLQDHPDPPGDERGAEVCRANGEDHQEPRRGVGTAHQEEDLPAAVPHPRSATGVRRRDGTLRGPDPPAGVLRRPHQRSLRRQG